MSKKLLFQAKSNSISFSLQHFVVQVSTVYSISSAFTVAREENDGLRKQRKQGERHERIAEGSTGTQTEAISLALSPVNLRSYKRIMKLPLTDLRKEAEWKTGEKYSVFHEAWTANTSNLKPSKENHFFLNLLCKDNHHFLFSKFLLESFSLKLMETV